jgi:Putative sensor
VTTQDLTARPPRPSTGAGRAPWWRAPFTPDTRRRTLYALLALPVGVASVPLALLGGGAAAARLQRGLGRRLLALPVAAPPRRAGTRAAAHALLSLPLNLVAFALTGYLWLAVLANLAYPARPWFGLGDGSYQDSWGGPTLAGAWAVHAAGGLLFLFLLPWVVRALTGAQGRLLHGLLGGPDPDRP